MLGKIIIIILFQEENKAFFNFLFTVWFWSIPQLWGYKGTHNQHTLNEAKPAVTHSYHMTKPTKSEIDPVSCSQSNASTSTLNSSLNSSEREKKSSDTSEKTYPEQNQ